ncbi:peptidase M1-like protein, partial [Flavobacterium sp. 5]
MTRKHLFLFIFLSINLISFGQTTKVYTLADTLRGSLTPERLWWDVLRYDITVKPDYDNKLIQGSNAITYKTLKEKSNTKMQIDLQEPLVIDSVIQSGKKLNFKKEGSVWYIETTKSKVGTTHKIELFYSGKVHEAINAPWDGGWIWTKDELGRPWMTVACQGLGASIWYPCKDHQSDEPNQGASLTMTVPTALTAIANGRLEFKKVNKDGTTTSKWAVVNPISNYCIIPYIGMYVNFKENYKGEKGNLDLNYWVLDYNLEKAKSYMPTEVHNMLKAF